MNPLEIIEKYADKNSKAYKILVRHSKAVTRKALEIAKRVPELTPDLEIIENGAMLHDVGTLLTNAPKIGCQGSEPYIKHGIIGGEIMRKEGHPEIARVCERHIGVGITADEIQRQGLPLPAQDFVPETIEEEIICFADNFFSKDPKDLDREESIEDIRKELAEFGQDNVREFNEWCRKFKEA